jgi:hypothetical protein
MLCQWIYYVFQQQKLSISQDKYCCQLTQENWMTLTTQSTWKQP